MSTAKTLLMPWVALVVCGLLGCAPAGIDDAARDAILDAQTEAAQETVAALRALDGPYERLMPVGQWFQPHDAARKVEALGALVDAFRVDPKLLAPRVPLPPEVTARLAQWAAAQALLHRLLQYHVASTRSDERLGRLAGDEAGFYRQPSYAVLFEPAERIPGEPSEPPLGKVVAITALPSKVEGDDGPRWQVDTVDRAGERENVDTRRLILIPEDQCVTDKSPHRELGLRDREIGSVAKEAADHRAYAISALAAIAERGPASGR